MNDSAVPPLMMVSGRRPAPWREGVDQSLVVRARDGDREAFAGLVRAVGDRLYALAYRLLRDPDLAQDAYQETMVTAWRQLAFLREPERFEAWTRRILVRQCYAETRRRARLTSTGSVADRLPTGTDEGRAIHDRDELERAFRALSLDHRAVVVLHHYLGLSLVEVAETLGIPQGTARSRLHYATQALRRTLDDQAAPATAKEGLA
jgi:RNA polymerase sigma-70 factor (ECF subfamily)